MILAKLGKDTDGSGFALQYKKDNDKAMSGAFWRRPYKCACLYIIVLEACAGMGEKCRRK
jgi:hypothetical protein